METHVIKCLGQRLLADPAFQHFYTVLIARDARFLGAGAQGVDQLGGPPMGMHIDHGCLLSFFVQRINPESPSVREVGCHYRAMYFNRHSEASAFPHPCCWPGSSIEV